MTRAAIAPFFFLNRGLTFTKYLWEMDWHEAKARRTVSRVCIQARYHGGWDQTDRSANIRIGLFLYFIHILNFLYILKIDFGRIFQWIVCEVGKKRVINYSSKCLGMSKWKNEMEKVLRITYVVERWISGMLGAQIWTCQSSYTKTWLEWVEERIGNEKFWKGEQKNTEVAIGGSWNNWGYYSRTGEIIAYLHTDENDPIERKNWHY